MKETQFIPLSQETRELLKNKEAAVHLRMQPQCLQTKANDPDFPIKPVRLMRHLLWKTSDLKKFLGITA